MSVLRNLKHRADDRGVALPFIAVVLVLLLGMAAFAVDLGWIFLNGARVQRAADSAALAGVVYLPGDITGVDTFTVNGAQANGYDIGNLNGSPLLGGGADDLDWTAVADNKLEVSLDSSIETFFLKVFGFNSFDIKRVSTAEYIKPVPLGSPGNCIGIGQSITDDGLPGSASAAFSLCNTFPQNFWAAMNGRATALEHGDPYGTECGYQCSGTNPNWPASGQNYYYYGIEVPSGQNWVDVFIYDAAFYDRSNFGEAGDEDDLSFSSSGGTHMTYSVFEPDGTPLIPSDNSTPACGGLNGVELRSEQNAGTYKNRWVRLCRINTSSAPGLYVLRVANRGSSIGGNNDYSILVNSDNLTSASIPRVYAINSMSIFTNAPGGQATVYIAEVQPVHAGKILELVFYDAGESSGNADMTVLAPPGVTGYSCSWTATQNFGPNQPTSGSSCTIQTTVNGVAQFNGEWITMNIQLPDQANYNCTTDCFWKMDLDLNVSHDRTTWEAKVIGNPVKLTPNQ
jgi:Putative Flp pilus-assembly TadE/G-like